MNCRKLYDYGVMPIHIGALVLCALLLLLGWLFGLGPLMSQSNHATSVIEQAEQAEFEAKKIKGELDRLSDELDLVQRELDEQPINLSSATQINPLLVELAGWSETYQLTITRTHAGRRQSLTYYDYVAIQITGEGGFADLMSFLKHLHVQRSDMGVTAFDVVRQPNGLGVSFEVELAWYVLSDGMEPGPELTPRPTASVPTERAF